MKKLSYSSLFSHPNKKLEDHLENVANLSEESFNSLFFTFSDLFSKISFLIGLSHDFAKSTSFFQDYLLTEKKNENTPHSFLSAVFTYYVVNDYLLKNQIDFDEDLSIIAYIVVLFHHGNLKNISDLDDYHEKHINLKRTKKQFENIKNSKINLSSFYKQWDIDFFEFFNNIESINEEIIDKLFSLGLNENTEYYFYIILFYSILLDSDKMDASQSNVIARNNIPECIVDKYKEKNFHDMNIGINKTRQKAYMEVNNHIAEIDLTNRIFSINLPTGIGKTLTGLSSVLRLKNRINNEYDINPRIIYSLPFLSIIDQNENIIRDIFNTFDLKGSNFLLKHNYLADMKYIDTDKNEVYGIDNSKILIESWNSEFIITTFIQLFNSLIGNKNSFLRKFHNITNSIILLDEIQSVPYKYWNVINFILNKMAYDYNCWIVLMTATQPLIFKEDEIIPLVDNVDYYFNQFNRIKYNFDLDEISLEDFCDNFINCVTENDDKDIMAVLNTIKSSKELYEYVKNHFDNYYIDENGICQIGDNTQLVYLSTHIVPYHRLEKINKIKNSNKRNIIITTQLIEAGVDIDADIVFRDLAPLDSIIQTAGRCNRNNKKDTGYVNVISIKNNEGKLYSNFVYDSLLINTTREILNQYSIIDEKNFNLNASRKYFELLSDRKEPNEKLNDYISRLKFNDIPNEFKLIKNNLPKFDVFVCVNQDAEDIFKQYKNITKNYNGFDKKNAFLSIKNQFYKYVISIDEKKLGSINFYNEEIGIICPGDLNRKYSLDEGFIVQDDETTFII